MLIAASMVSVLFFGIALSVPALSLFALSATPLPGALISARYRIEAGRIWLLGSSAVIALAIGGEVALGFLLTLGVVGVMIGTGLRIGWRLETILSVAIAAWCVGLFILSIAYHGGPAGAFSAVTAHVEEGFDVALKASESSGASAETVELLQSQREMLIESFSEMLPAIFFIIGGLIAFVNLQLSRFLLGIREGQSFGFLRVPDPFIWVLIASGFAMFLSLPVLTLWAKNVFAIILACYFVQGLAVFSFFCDRFQLSRGLRAVGYVLIAVQHVVMALVLAVGVFDLWGDFRRLRVIAADVIPGDSD